MLLDWIIIKEDYTTNTIQGDTTVGIVASDATECMKLPMKAENQEEYEDCVRRRRSYICCD